MKKMNTDFDITICANDEEEKNIKEFTINQILYWWDVDDTFQSIKLESGVCEGIYDIGIKINGFILDLDEHEFYASIEDAIDGMKKIILKMKSHLKMVEYKLAALSDKINEL